MIDWLKDFKFLIVNIKRGCFTINDIRKIVGEEPIEEEWANQFFMTKNYATVEELLKGLEGGEKS